MYAWWQRPRHRATTRVAPTMRRLGKLVRAWWQRNVFSFARTFHALCHSPAESFSRRFFGAGRHSRRDACVAYGAGGKRQGNRTPGDPRVNTSHLRTSHTRRRCERIKQVNKSEKLLPWIERVRGRHLAFLGFVLEPALR